MTNPHNPDANTFSFDQLWIDFEHAVNSEHRAGFRADFVFGKTGDILSGSGNSHESGDEHDLNVHQAYVQYLAPTGKHTEGIGLSDIRFRAGKFSTPVGAEVAYSTGNWQISRGNVYNLLQPIDHVGISADAELGQNWDVALMVVNDITPLDTDNNNAKTYLGHIGYTGENWSASLNGLWGPHVSGSEEADRSLVDLVLTYDPCDRVSTWLNFDYARVDGEGLSMGEAWGVAGAARYAITDRLGFSVRGEWFDDDGDYLANAGLASFSAADDFSIMSFTGTLDYALTGSFDSAPRSTLG